MADALPSMVQMPCLTIHAKLDASFALKSLLKVTLIVSLLELFCKPNQLQLEIDK